MATDAEGQNFIQQFTCLRKKHVWPFADPREAQRMAPNHRWWMQINVHSPSNCEAAPEPAFSGFPCPCSSCPESLPARDVEICRDRRGARWTRWLSWLPSLEVAG